MDFEYFTVKGVPIWNTEKPFLGRDGKTDAMAQHLQRNVSVHLNLWRCV